MAYLIHILQRLALFSIIAGITPVFPGNISPDYQSVIHYCDQIEEASRVFGETVSQFSVDYQKYRNSRHSIRAGKSYPHLPFVSYPQPDLLTDSTWIMPLFPDTTTRVVFRDLINLYETAMEDFTASRWWLSNHTQSYVYSLAQADSACATLDAQLRYLQMIHGELRQVLTHVRSEAIAQVLKTVPGGTELIQMKREILSIHHLVRTLNRIQPGETQESEVALSHALQLIESRQRQYPALSLHPIFMSHDYLLSAALIPQTEQLLASCQAKDYEYLNLYFRHDLEGIFEAYRALTDQFSYQAAEWEPYLQEFEEPIPWYSDNYPTAPPSTLKQMPLTNEASSDAR